jgi:adenine-specific DNA-methyltransferase
LTGAKKFSKDGEQDFKCFVRDEAGTIKDNLIIKGNNLLALHSLKKEFAGKVKLIYIDPPYNTGGKGDTFTYNNNFKRSTWLTFMYNRLNVAQELLSKDGILIVAIDENE